MNIPIRRAPPPFPRPDAPLTSTSAIERNPAGAPVPASIIDRMRLAQRLADVAEPSNVVVLFRYVTRLEPEWQILFLSSVMRFPVLNMQLAHSRELVSWIESYGDWLSKPSKPRFRVPAVMRRD